MPRPTTIKGTAAWARHADGPSPTRLDDLAGRIGSRLDAIRDALRGEPDIAAAVARDVAQGDDFLLVATRAGLQVWCLGSLNDARPAVTAWPMVRVSPVRSDGGWDRGARQPELETHSCQVRVAGTTFVIMADGASGQSAIGGFHDEVVRRGTPWHYPG